jgi:hypothetical protein
MSLVTFHALPTWPYPDTHPRRGRYIFRAGWADTLDLIARELGHLEAFHVVLQAGFREGDLRLDGLPRADAREPNHPGVILSFESRVGPQRYASDAHEWWQHNVRAIGLGLEALRAVDRYGITRSDEQYAGWKQLTAGSGITTRDAARGLIARLLDVAESTISEDGNALVAQYRQALKRAHPDHGGSTELLASVRDAGRVLDI